MKLLIATLALLFTGAKALECFHCTDCDQEAAIIVDCGRNEQCFSVLGPVTRRGCAHDCPFDPEFMHEECHVCSDDLCNIHQIEHVHVHRPARHLRVHRKRRDDLPGGRSAAITRHYPDGSKQHEFVDAAEELPPLPQAEEDDYQEGEVIYLPRDDPRLGKVINGKLFQPLEDVGSVGEGEQQKELIGTPVVQAPTILTNVDTHRILIGGNPLAEIKTNVQPVIPKEDLIDENDVLKEGDIIESVKVLSSDDVKTEDEIDKEVRERLPLPKPALTDAELLESKTKDHGSEQLVIPTDMTDEELEELMKRLEDDSDDEPAPIGKGAEPVSPTVADKEKSKKDPDASSSLNVFLCIALTLIAQLMF